LIVLCILHIQNLLLYPFLAEFLMAFYESTFILRQDIATTEVEKITEDFTTTITQLGGKIVKKEFWGLRDLAYKISKSKKGHYVHLALDANAACIKEFDRKLGLSEDVLRTLILRVEAISKEPARLNDNRDTE
jgi:small subunit ribosomal protein S6